LSAGSATVKTPDIQREMRQKRSTLPLRSLRKMRITRDVAVRVISAAELT
jgi:hypothetical protein